MRPPIRIRSFILGSVLVLLLVPTLAGGAGWLIERDHQHAAIQQRLNTAVGYLTTHRNDLKASLPAFASLLATPGPARRPERPRPDTTGKGGALPQPGAAANRRPGQRRAAPGATALSGTRSSWSHDRRLIPADWAGSPATLVADLYYRPASDAARTIVALVSGLVVLFAGLAVAVWLAGRWMVNPLTRLSSQVDKVAGGELAITVPRSRIGEITNIAQAIEGMTAALAETEQARVEADQARRFLITSIAHDLRTPLFALRGHLQALHSNLGDPAVHLEPSRSQGRRPRTADRQPLRLQPR